jgi:flagellar basal-body rod protein FlgG
VVFIVATDPGVHIEQTTEQVQRLPMVAGLVYGGSLSAWASAFMPGTSATGGPIAAPLRIATRFQANQVRTMFQTDDSYDLAIQGHGFLTVTTPLGQTSYTRVGALQVSDRGALMTASGATVQPAITIPQDAIDVAISKTGEVQVKRPGTTQMQTVGQIKLATFANEAGLEAADEDRFVETSASGPPAVDAPGKPGFGMLLQGYVEPSDASPVDTLR